MKNDSHGDLPLDSRQLNAFVSLAETGSYTETARRLSLTQSAISHSMRALESSTHCRLLARMGNSVVLTEAGEALLHYARLGLKELNNGREALERLKKWGRQRLRVGADSAVAHHFLPAVIADLRRQFPKVAPTVKTILSLDNAESLRFGEIDCYIGEPPRSGDDLESTPLFQSRLALVAPQSHRWSSRPPVSLEELSREPCLPPPRDSAARAMMETALARVEAVLNIIGETDSFEITRELVKAGIAPGILPEWTINRDLADRSLRVVPSPLPELFQSIGLLRWRRRRPMDACECAFRNICVKAGKKISTQGAVITAV